MKGVSQERNITMETYITRITLEGWYATFKRHEGRTMLEVWIETIKTLAERDMSGTAELWAIADGLPEPINDKPDLFAKIDVQII